MLTLRERIIIFYAIAPKGFSATRLQLRRKFQPVGKKIYAVIDRLVGKGVLERREGDEIVAGKWIREEIL